MLPDLSESPSMACLEEWPDGVSVGVVCQAWLTSSAGALCAGPIVIQYQVMQVPTGAVVQFDGQPKRAFPPCPKPWIDLHFLPYSRPRMAMSRGPFDNRCILRPNRVEVLLGRREARTRTELYAMARSDGLLEEPGQS